MREEVGFTFTIRNQ